MGFLLFACLPLNNNDSNGNNAEEGKKIDGELFT